MATAFAHMITVISSPPSDSVQELECSLCHLSWVSKGTLPFPFEGSTLLHIGISPLAWHLVVPSSSWQLPCAESVSALVALSGAGDTTSALSSGPPLGSMLFLEGPIPSGCMTPVVCMGPAKGGESAPSLWVCLLGTTAWDFPMCNNTLVVLKVQKDCNTT